MHSECDLDQAWDSPYDCEGYRLPTEAEWEYAARAGTTSAFSNGGNLSDGQEATCDGPIDLDNGEFLDDIAVYCGNHDDENTSDPVGGKQPNAWGLHDMHGNVMEWVADRGNEDDYSTDEVDPWVDEEGERAARRGGAAIDAALYLRSGERGWSWATAGGYDISFRVARTE